jgi:hypothetical protein
MTHAPGYACLLGNNLSPYTKMFVFESTAFFSTPQVVRREGLKCFGMFGMFRRQEHKTAGEGGARVAFHVAVLLH